MEEYPTHSWLTAGQPKSVATFRGVRTPGTSCNCGLLLATLSSAGTFAVDHIHDRNYPAEVFVAPAHNHRATYDGFRECLHIPGQYKILLNDGRRDFSGIIHYKSAAPPCSLYRASGRRYNARYVDGGCALEPTTLHSALEAEETTSPWVRSLPP